MYKFGRAEGEIRLQRQDVAERFKKQMLDLLETSLEIYETILLDSPADVATDILKTRIGAIKQWIDDVLDDVIRVMEDDAKDEEWALSVRIPPRVAQQMLYCIAKVISCGRDFEDNDYYLINRIRLILSLDNSITLKILDQVLYHNKKEDFDRLIQQLDADQRFSFASLLYKAIQADEKLHPSELKYMQNINQLLGNDETVLELVEKEGMDTDHFPIFNLTEPYADYLFTLLVEIVLCDDEYDPQESEFITKAAKVLGIDESRKEHVEQSIASALIAKSTLFDDSFDYSGDC